MWSASSVLILPSFFLSALGALALAGCDSPRERPTGLSAPLPATTVTVLKPETDDVVPSDSTAIVVIEAQGLVTAVELLLVRNALPDTLARERREFGEPVELAQEQFEVRIPAFVTGVHLEIRGVAEDAIGQRHFSKPVFVVVIECDVFPLACGGP
jgi:hypothetical protein